MAAHLIDVIVCPPAASSALLCVVFPCTLVSLPALTSRQLLTQIMHCHNVDDIARC